MDSNEIGRILGKGYETVARDGAAVLGKLGLSSDANVLDVGTGNGNFAIFLAAQGYDVVTGEPATDGSRYAGKDWATAAQRVGLRDRIRFEAFDASELPFESASFEAVFFCGVLHHIDEDIRRAVLDEALRVASRSGAVVFMEPRSELLERIWEEDPGHPLAACPIDYLSNPEVAQEFVEGALLDTYVFRNPV